MAKDFVTITVKDDKDFFEQLALLPEKGAKTAMSRAINDALRKGKKEFGSRVAKVYNMKVGEIKSYAKETKATPRQTSKARIEVRSRRFTVGQTHFSANPDSYIQPGTKNEKGKVIKKKPQKVKIRKDKGWKEISSGFIANPSSVNGGNTMVWIRMGKKRTPIAPVRTVSAAQMLSNKEIAEGVQDEMQKYYLQRLDHHLGREFDRLK